MVFFHSYVSLPEGKASVDGGLSNAMFDFRWATDLGPRITMFIEQITNPG